MKRRVVITGIGVITPVGTGKEKFWNAVKLGKSGVGPVTRFNADSFPTRIAGEVKDFDPAGYLDRKEARRMDRFTQFAVVASKMAVADAELDLNREDRNAIGVILGTGIGGIETFEEQHRVMQERGPGRISPFFIPMMIANMGAAQAAILLGLKGPNFTTVSACAASANALVDALRVIQNGEAEVMITGGAEAAITPMAMGGFCSMKAVSTRNDEPERASRPFDQQRDGFVLGEGAGALVLESLEHARQRGATIYAELAGGGCTGDAYHITAPDPEAEGAARAMELAIQDAGLNREDINYINAHGTSTDLNDKQETEAIKKVFGPHAYRLAVSSTKSVMGHLLGAAGAVEAIVTALAIRDGVVPPTINYENPDPECDLDYVPNTARRLDIQAALSNSFGFGGHNVTIAIKGFRG